MGDRAIGRASVAAGVGAAAVLALAAPAAAAAVTGSWRALPPAPLPGDERTLTPLDAEWTGRGMVVFRSGRPDRAASYAPGRRRWRTLTPPTVRTGYLQIPTRSVWTGTEMVMVGGSNVAYAPRTDRWRRVPGVAPGVVVWTGREVVGWGGGCCGDAWDTGAAYTPSSGGLRTIAPSPLVGRQSPPGVWTGTELVIAGGADPDGHPYRGGAAYDPRTDTWRRISPMPTPYAGTIAVWTGREVVVLGGSRTGAGFAYNPCTDRWRALPRMAHGIWNEFNSVAVWTGTRLMVWGGQTQSSPTRPGATPVAPRGVAYDPAADRWSNLPASPLTGFLGSVTGVWTGDRLIVWTQSGSGAAFRPRTP